MIEALINSMDAVFNSKDWVGRYGGLVKTRSREIEQPGEGSGTKTETFPVPRGTTEGCAGDECNDFLLPDESKKSIVFWHLQGDVKIEPPKRNISRARGNMQYTQVVRLIVWLNFKGCDNCDDTSYAAYAQELTNEINRARVTSGDPIGAAGRVKLTAEVDRTPRDVFGDWSFSEIAYLFQAPFDFFALEFTFEWFQNATCPTQPVC